MVAPARAADPAPVHLLALLLAAPEAESLEVLEELAGSLPWLAAALPELAALPLDQWQAEHTRLFVSGRPRTPCLPFASAWRAGSLHGPQSTALAAFYREEGIEPAVELPADYLGTALEAAAWLEARGRTDPLATLWREHLDPWVPQLAEALQAEARLRLYRELGAALAGVCPREARQDE